MSIEMDNPQTVGEKIDAAANLVEQMKLAHSIGDDRHFTTVHARAGQLLFDAMRQLEKAERSDKLDERLELPGIYKKFRSELGGDADIIISMIESTYQARGKARAEVAGPAWTDIAEAAYEAYKANVGGKAYDGSSLPSWADVDERLQTAWEASVRHASNVIQGSDVTPAHWAGWQRP